MLDACIHTVTQTSSHGSMHDLLQSDSPLGFNRIALQAVKSLRVASLLLRCVPMQLQIFSGTRRQTYFSDSVSLTLLHFPVLDFLSYGDSSLLAFDSELNCWFQHYHCAHLMNAGLSTEAPRHSIYTRTSTSRHSACSSIYPCASSRNHRACNSTQPSACPGMPHAAR